MNDQAAIERLLAERLADSGRVLPRPGSVDRIITQARVTRPSPRWLATLKEPPMRHASRVVVGSPTARVAALAAVTMLVAIAGAGAIVVAAQPSPSPIPVDVPTAGAAVWVTGTCPYSGTQVGSPSISTEDGVTKTYGLHWEGFRPCDMSDPRLIGTGALIGNTHTHAVEGDDPIIVMSQTYRIENEAGSWQGVGGPGLARGPGTGLDTVTDTAVYVGTGAYEGMTAYLVYDFSQNPVTVTGAIFPGELPPVVTFEELPEE